MKNLFKVALISGALFLGVNAYCQTQTTKTPSKTPTQNPATDTKKTENQKQMSFDDFLSNVPNLKDYEKKILLDAILERPFENFNVDSASCDVLKDYYLLTSKAYEIITKQYGNMKRDNNILNEKYQISLKTIEKLRADTAEMRQDYLLLKEESSNSNKK